MNSKRTRKSITVTTIFVLLQIAFWNIPGIKLGIAILASFVTFSIWLLIICLLWSCGRNDYAKPGRDCPKR